MGWDSSTKVLHYPFTKIAANGNGDLQKALNSSRTTQTGLFQYGTVNKWAKYKAITSSESGFPNQIDSNHLWKSAAAIIALGETPWWRGANGNCGLNTGAATIIGTPSTNGLIKALITDGVTGILAWNYVRPTGALRAFDFIEYKADAAPPIAGLPNEYTINQRNLVVTPTITTSGLSLSFDDVTVHGVKLSDCYLGILIYYSSDIYLYKTSGKISDGDLSVTFTNVSSLGGRNVTIAPFYSSKPILTQNVDPGQGVYMSCDIAPKTVLIEPEPYTAVISGRWTDNTYRSVSYNIQLRNDSGTALTNKSIVASVYRSDQSQALASLIIRNVSVPNNDYTNLTGTITNISDTHSASATYTLRVTSDYWNDEGPIYNPL